MGNMEKKNDILNFGYEEINGKKKYTVHFVDKEPANDGGVLGEAAIREATRNEPALAYFIDNAATILITDSDESLRKQLLLTSLIDTIQIVTSITNEFFSGDFEKIGGTKKYLELTKKWAIEYFHDGIYLGKKMGALPAFTMMKITEVLGVDSKKLS